jgi:hypothetical protein
MRVRRHSFLSGTYLPFCLYIFSKSKAVSMFLFRQQKIADREKRAAEQQRKKMEKEAQRLMKKEQNKIGVKLS